MAVSVPRRLAPAAPVRRRGRRHPRIPPRRRALRRLAAHAERADAAARGRARRDASSSATSGGVLVTAPERRSSTRARRVLVELDDLLAAATRGQRPVRGHAPRRRDPDRRAVPPALRHAQVLATRWPRLRLVLVEEKTDDSCAAFAAGTLDAGLLALVDGWTTSSTPSSSTIRSSSPSLQAHPLAKKKTVSLGDLDDEPVLLLEDGHCFRTQALALCSRAGAPRWICARRASRRSCRWSRRAAGVTLLPSIARRRREPPRPARGPPARRSRAQPHALLAWRKAAPLGGALRELAKTMATASRPATRLPQNPRNLAATRPTGAP